MKLTEQQTQNVGKAIQLMFLARNQVLGGNVAVAWIELLSEDMTYEQIMTSCKYHCKHGGPFLSVEIIRDYIIPSDEQCAEKEWLMLCTGKKHTKLSLEIYERLGRPNLDEMNSYEKNQVKKDYIALYKESKQGTENQGSLEHKKELDKIAE